MPYEIIKQPQQLTKVNILSSIAFNDVDTGLLLSNAKYPLLSAQYSTIYSNISGTATYALPGGLIIKGQSPTYDTSVQNLPGIGNYGLYLQNVNNMDPGTTFVSDGRAAITHGMTFRAGIANFTSGSDHTHVIWQGAPSNATQGWQVTMGGNRESVYGYTPAAGYTNRFFVHTLPQFQISTTITANSGGYVDTRNAQLLTGTDRLTGVVIGVKDTLTTNYSLINVNEVVSLTFNPGVAGIVAASYNSQCTQVSANPSLTAFQFDLFIGNAANWVPALKDIQNVNLLARAQGGNPGVSQVTSQIGTPLTDYVGLTGNYKNVKKHILVRFTNSNILTGLKPGSPLTLWVPVNMPSSSPAGTGFIVPDRPGINLSNATTYRYGYFDAYVRNKIGSDLEISIGNIMDSYAFENVTISCSADGSAGWVLYGGSQDSVHRPTFGTVGFYFERENYRFTSANNFAYLSGGTVKNSVLGSVSESYGNFSYGLGYQGVVTGNYSGNYAGKNNYVFGDNSVTLGGTELVSISSNQIVIGTYNNPNTNSIFVVGSGSELNRKNVLEITTDGTVVNDFNVFSTISDDYTFNNNDKGRTFHVDNRSTPTSGIYLSFPSDLNNGFNVDVILLGTKTVNISSTQAPVLCASFTSLSDAFTKTTFYKFNNDVYGVKGGGGGSGPEILYTAELLMVGGGGGGVIGGGGAGGVRTTSTTIIIGQTYDVVVGGGGSGVTYGTNTGNSGSSSSFGNLVAQGGGSGGSFAANPAGGGSGGGSAGVGTTRLGGSGTVGQGNKGGDMLSSGTIAAGGGGSSQAGIDNVGLTGTGTNGGSGLTWYTNIHYGGGGGGAASTGTVGQSGLGGGGVGGKPGTNPSSGVVNTGGGGGGGFENTSGSGGSGIIIIRYQGSQRGTGGTVTLSGGYVYHTFTGSGQYIG